MEQEFAVGTRFSRLVIVGQGEKRNGAIHVKCLCDCGKITRPSIYKLRSGRIKSCGCLKHELLLKASTTHGQTVGHAPTPEYVTWASMKQRCTRAPSEYKCSHRYLGRGIAVCDRWKDSFENFLADMGPKPTPRHSIERLDNAKGYSPDNCIWADMKAQQRNRTNNRRIVAGEAYGLLCEWAEFTGIKRETIRDRIDRYGWSPLRAVTTQAGHSIT